MEISKSFKRMRVYLALASAAVFSTANAAGSNAPLPPPKTLADYKVEISANTSPVSPSGHAIDSTVYPMDSSDYKVVGGGAAIYIDNNYGLTTGVFLTSSSPKLLSSDVSKPIGWTASARPVTDDEYSHPTALITPYVLAVYDPDNDWEVKVFTATSSKAVNHPAAEVYVPADYTLTGGGAVVKPVNVSGHGNFLYQSKPVTRKNSDQSVSYGWSAASKDHAVVDLANITVYAIGIKPSPTGASKGMVKPTIQIVTGASSGSVSTSPVAQVSVFHNLPIGTKCVMTGGGADDQWYSTPNAFGNMLTTSYPAGTHTWIANGKSQNTDDRTTITVNALCLN